jgi:hypothetical protein
MAKKDVTSQALKNGIAQAQAVLQLRNEALQTRQSALDDRAKSLGLSAFSATVADAQKPAWLAPLAAALSAGTLVAEGDSWFDYPWTDVLRLLEDRYGYDVESVAHKGDRVEDMAYNGGQLLRFTRTLEKLLLLRSTIPRAILLSGGGNDVAGAEFYTLLNYANSPTPGLNNDVVTGVLERIRLAYITILSGVTHVCQERINQKTPILVHGYDYPVPDGRGFLGGWGPLPGPWLAPGFRQKGYEVLKQRKEIVKDLIDRFNDMLAGVAALPEFKHVNYINLRNTLSTGPDYKKWWDNELHPTREGFKLVAERFAKVI